MSAAHVLLILTLLADGQMSAAFVNSPSAEQCAARGEAIGAVLRKGGANVQQMRCIPSALRFARFSHADAQTAPRHTYTLSYSDTTLELQPRADLAACQALLEQAGALPAANTLCVTSTQTLDPS